MIAGIRTTPETPVYRVIVIVPSDTSYVKSSDCKAKAALGKAKANANMAEKKTAADDIDFLLFIVSSFSIFSLKAKSFISIHNLTSI